MAVKGNKKVTEAKAFSRKKSVKQAGSAYVANYECAPNVEGDILCDRYARKKKRGTIHDRYRSIKVRMANSSEEFITCSTYHQDELVLDVDRKTHPAWTKVIGQVDMRATEVSKFNERYGTLNFLGKASSKVDE